MIMLSATAYAAEVETYVDFDTRDVYISGAVEQASQNRMISVIISDDSEQYYVNTVGTASDGSYSFIFRMPETAATGYYDITVDALGLDELITKEFYFAKSDDIEQVLTLINNASSASEVRSSVDANTAVLNIPDDWYKSLGSDGKKAVAEALYAKKPYRMIGDATSVAISELAVQSFRYASDADKVEKALEKFADIYGINENTSACYGLYADNGKAAREIMASYTPDTVAGVAKAFDESVLLAAINSARDPRSVGELMDGYRAVIPFSLDTYDKANEEKMVSYLYKNAPFRSMTALQSAITAAYKQETSQSSGGSGGGGGGGSSSGGGGGSSKSGGSSGGGGSIRPSNSINLPPSVSTQQPEADTEGTAAPEEGFTDIGGYEWAKEAITYLSKRQIVSGTGDNKFEPGSFVTREQFVLMIVNAFNIDSTGASSGFADMPEDHWAYKAVSAACEKGIIFGFSDSEFGTGKSITRQDMAVIAYRAAKLSGYQFDSSQEIGFTDRSEISDYASESVAAMSAKGIITGYPDGRFGAFDTANRAQAAQIMYNIIK